MLARGLTFAGRVIDDKTGGPVEGVKMRLMPKDWASPDVYARTDAKGEFAISTLRPVTYFLHLEGVYPPDTFFDMRDGSQRSSRRGFADVDPSKESHREIRIVSAPGK